MDGAYIFTADADTVVNKLVPFVEANVCAVDASLASVAGTGALAPMAAGFAAYTSEVVVAALKESLEGEGTVVEGGGGEVQQDACVACAPAAPCFDGAGCAFHSDGVWASPYDACNTGGAAQCAGCFPACPAVAATDPPTAPQCDVDAVPSLRAKYDECVDGKSKKTSLCTCHKLYKRGLNRANCPELASTGAAHEMSRYVVVVRCE